MFPVDVNDESTAVGGSAVFKCSIPASEHSYVRVEQWTVNDALTINRDSLIGELLFGCFYNVCARLTSAVLSG